jgi:hypothetical protein
MRFEIRWKIIESLREYSRQLGNYIPSRMVDWIVFLRLMISEFLALKIYV